MDKQATQTVQQLARGELIGVGVLVVIGVALLALAPVKQASFASQGAVAK